MELITGDTIDFSEWTDFGYYELLQYWDKQESEENLSIRRWLGVSPRVGRAFCYWILTAKGMVIEKTTVQHVTNDEAATDDFQSIIGHYHKCLAEDFGQGYHYASDLDGLEGFTNDDVPNPYKAYGEAYNGPNLMLNVDDYVKNTKDTEAAVD